MGHSDDMNHAKAAAGRAALVAWCGHGVSCHLPDDDDVEQKNWATEDMLESLMHYFADNQPDWERCLELATKSFSENRRAKG